MRKPGETGKQDGVTLEISQPPGVIGRITRIRSSRVRARKQGQLLVIGLKMARA